jgi:hypothetical protein
MRKTLDELRADIDAGRVNMADVETWIAADEHANVEERRAKMAALDAEMSRRSMEAALYGKDRIAYALAQAEEGVPTGKANPIDPRSLRGLGRITASFKG